MLCIDQDMLALTRSERPAAREWLSQYAELPVAGHFVWVTGLREAEMDEEDVRDLRELVKQLRGQGGRPVLKVYGGYLSALLWHHGLSGFSFGPGYGEERNVEPVGGGLPQPKFYFPPVHQRLAAVSVARLLPRARNDYLADICNCAECLATISTDVAAGFADYMRTDVHISQRPGGTTRRIRYATFGTRQRLTRHYLHCRGREAEYVGSHTLDEAKQQLRDAHAAYGAALGLDDTAHLLQWADGL
jgi:hypothetical protein